MLKSEVDLQGDPRYLLHSSPSIRAMNKGTT